jgi:hypothetical protein
MYHWPPGDALPDFVALRASLEALFREEKRSVLESLGRPCLAPDPAFGHPVESARADFQPRYDPELPPLTSLKVQLKKYALHTAKTAVESESFLREIAALGAETAEAVREWVEIHEQVVTCEFTCELADPVLETVSVVQEGVCVATELTVETCLTTALTTKSQLVSVKFGSVFEVIRQLDRLAHGKTDGWSAFARSVVAITAIGLSTWGAKAAGSVLGLVVGGPAGAAWLGAAASLAASRYTAKFLAEYFVREVRRALERLNTLERQRAKRMHRARERTVVNLTSAQKAVEAQRELERLALWKVANEQLSVLYQNYLMIGRELFDSAWSELIRMSAEIGEGTARRDFLAGLTPLQRVIFWCSKTTRRSVDQHFEQRSETIDCVLSKAWEPQIFEDQLVALLRAIHGSSLYSAGMRARVECFLEQTNEICARARSIRSEVESELVRRGLELIDELHATIAPMTKRYHDIVTRTATVSAGHREKVVKLADKAGLQLVFSR